MTTSADQRRRPVARAYAVVEQRDSRAHWIQVAPVWLNSDGSLGLTMHVEPTAWRHPARPHKLVIRFEDATRLMHVDAADNDTEDDPFEP